MTEQERRGLNRRVAVEVMGAERIAEREGRLFAIWARPFRNNGSEYIAHIGEHLENYSTDIAAAWQVVERMRELGWRVSVWTNADVWCAQFEQEIDYCETAPTAPEAICAAALAALGKGEA